MTKFKITYFLYPAENIEIIISAKDEDDAIVFAKSYRKDSFSIESI